MAIKRYFNKVFDASILRFALVGVINTLVGTAIMFVVDNVCHFGYWFSSASNYVIASVLSFFLNKYYTFRCKAGGVGAIIRFVVNILLCYFLAYGFAKPIMNWALSEASLTVRENVAMATGMVIFVGLNYLGQRFFVFRKRKTGNTYAL